MFHRRIVAVVVVFHRRMQFWCIGVSPWITPRIHSDLWITPKRPSEASPRWVEGKVPLLAFGRSWTLLELLTETLWAGRGCNRGLGGIEDQHALGRRIVQVRPSEFDLLQLAQGVRAEVVGGVAENGKNRTPSHRQRPVSDLNRRACGVAARQAFQLHWVFGFRSLPPG